MPGQILMVSLAMQQTFWHGLKHLSTEQLTATVFDMSERMCIIADVQFMDARLLPHAGERAAHPQAWSK
jgi:hypothetical protein